MKTATLCVLAILLAAGQSRAQTEPPSRPGPWSLDVHGVTSPVPQDPYFYPAFDTTALVPARGFGLDVGAHVYLFDLGAARLGIGGSLTTIRATTKPPKVITAPGVPPLPPGQSVQVDLMHMAPHVSLNFGTRGGWSYISGGMGATMVRTQTAGVLSGQVETAPLWEFDRFWRFQDYNMLHVGGGARWFAKDHMAFSFDIRLHRVKPGTITPGLMLVAIGAGVSFR